MHCCIAEYCLLGISAHLLQMGAHTVPGSFWVFRHDRVHHALVVLLPALRSARHGEDQLALIAEQIEN